MKSIDELINIAVIDDDADIREALELQVELWERHPVIFTDDHLGSISAFLDRPTPIDAGITDLKLQSSGYAQFNGAELASRWMRQRVPSILCTRFESAEIIQIRPYLRYIPSILAPFELEPERIEAGFLKALAELEGNFSEDRKPWRAQVHFIDSGSNDPDMLLVELPSWHGSDRIWVSRKALPLALQALAQPGFRTFAQVNLGAEAGQSLYISDWETRR